MNANSHRFGLLELLLLVAAIGSWVAYASLRSQTDRLEGRLPVMAREAGELWNVDTKKYVVLAVDTQPGVQEWVMSVPEPGCEICFAQNGIKRDGMPPIESAEYRIALNAGLHKLAIAREKEADKHFRIVHLNGKQVRRWETYNPSGATSTSGVGNEQESRNADKPWVFHRARFAPVDDSGMATSPSANEPAQGLAMWLRPFMQDAAAEPPSVESE